MQDGALLNKISALDEPSIETLTSANELDVPITKIADVHLKATLEWFSQQKSSEVENHNFGSDQLCMLVLAYNIITDIPQNLKNKIYSFISRKRFAILGGLLL